jgi:hypothetical protein
MPALKIQTPRNLWVNRDLRGELLMIGHRLLVLYAGRHGALTRARRQQTMRACGSTRWNIGSMAPSTNLNCKCNGNSFVMGRLSNAPEVGGGALGHRATSAWPGHWAGNKRGRRTKPREGLVHGRTFSFKMHDRHLKLIAISHLTLTLTPTPH